MSPTGTTYAGSHTIAKFLTEKQLIMVFREQMVAPEMVEWTREQILNESRKATVATGPVTEAEGGPGGALKHSRSLSDVKHAHKLHNPLQGTLRARDIRRLLIDLLDGDPEMLVRKHSILVKLPPVTAIVMHDRCFVFVPDGADSLLGVLRKNLAPQPSAQEHEVLPFELKAVEAIMVTVITEIRKDYKRLCKEVQCAFDGAKLNRNSTQSGGLEKLHQEKNKSAHFLLRLKAIRKCISELLDTDEDMALMNLTKIFRNPQRYTDSATQEWKYDHDEVELLLEAYLQEVETILNQAVFQQSEIEAYEGLVMLRLDSARNHLLRIELFVAMITSSAAVGSLVAGCFGMNLNSGLQDAGGWFWAVTLTLLLGMVFFVIAVTHIVWRQGWLIA